MASTAPRLIRSWERRLSWLTPRRLSRRNSRRAAPRRAGWRRARGREGPRGTSPERRGELPASVLALVLDSSTDAAAVPRAVPADDVDDVPRTPARCTATRWKSCARKSTPCIRSGENLQAFQAHMATTLATRLGDRTGQRFERRQRRCPGQVTPAAAAAAKLRGNPFLPETAPITISPDKARSLVDQPPIPA